MGSVTDRMRGANRMACWFCVRHTSVLIASSLSWSGSATCALPLSKTVNHCNKQGDRRKGPASSHFSSAASLTRFRLQKKCRRSTQSERNKATLNRSSAGRQWSISFL
eukprot:Protomagalhaensia_sp_Gyna_25__1547@NODE_1797_length_1532_cov_20_016745_g1474_i0_p2_GENE_NODE_1797_length_1532_cov_20_016745_g1474_i0NODE_1797_length_1532_cov_20_016745_g1474_i0_p2_ORF_typecomplete_len108_score5_24Ima1_N/PF09779_9/0_037_NODE_1797_length_1532_cov_20_016745_g1474_i012051528